MISCQECCLPTWGCRCPLRSRGSPWPRCGSVRRRSLPCPTGAGAAPMRMRQTSASKGVRTGLQGRLGQGLRLQRRAEALAAASMLKVLGKLAAFVRGYIGLLFHHP